MGITSERREAVGAHGLATMRHRVRSFGGHLEIDSLAPNGTQVRARLPLALILRPQPVLPLPAVASQ